MKTCEFCSNLASGQGRKLFSIEIINVCENHTEWVA